MPRAYLHDKPELIVITFPSWPEEHAVELRNVGVQTEVTEHQVFLLDLLNVVGDVLQDLNRHIFVCEGVLVKEIFLFRSR